MLVEIYRDKDKYEIVDFLIEEQVKENFIFIIWNLYVFIKSG